MMRNVSLVLLLGVLGWSGARAGGEKPNFLLLISDDQDWTGLSVRTHPDLPATKSSVMRTPNIAQLAKEGMRFSAAYAPAPVCSPTRISLQTGKSPAQLRWTKASPPVRPSQGLPLLEGEQEKVLRDEEVTIGEMLQAAGYATAHYGKWHLGSGGPERHGYHESDGDTGNGDAAPHKGDNPVDIFGMGRRAAAFMKKSKEAGKPFFIQMSYHALHYPENADPKTLAKYRELDGRRAGKAAITEDLDRGVGKLLGVVDELGLRETTYVIYMSDNGGGGSRRAGGGRPVRGGKGSVWEGGIRVPLIIRGPGVEADAWCAERVVGFDLYPTLRELAGVEAPLPKGVEGGSIVPHLRGSREPVKRPREELVFHFPHYQGDTPHSALFLGDYKALKFYETGEVKLFAIGKDIGEENDLARQKPEKARALDERLTRYLEEVGAALPTSNPQAVEGRTYGGQGARRGRAGGRARGDRPRGRRAR